jgi:hypothetical protein
MAKGKTSGKKPAGFKGFGAVPEQALTLLLLPRTFLFALSDSASARQGVLNGSSRVPMPARSHSRSCATKQLQNRVPENAATAPCGCYSGKMYAECCEPFHAGSAWPQEPLQLMRSRQAPALPRRNAAYARNQF